MFPRVDPLEAVDARLRDLAQRKQECADQDSAEVLELLDHCDAQLDRRLELTGRESTSGSVVPR